MPKPEIKPYAEVHRSELLSVWERSVLATHHFLKPEDFSAIKKLVQEMDFSGLMIYCLMDLNKVVGFIGLADTKIEMLFLDPAYIGQGLGKELLSFATSTLKANLVDVNEQNTNAVLFYKRYGFVAFERTEKDDQGNAYPLLRMELAGNE